MATAAAARVEAAEQAMALAADAYSVRIAGVVTARLRGPKARKGTRLWSDRVKQGADGLKSGGQGSYQHIEATDGGATTVELKAVDPDQVVPTSLTSDVVDTMRPVVMRVVRDAAADTAARLRDPGVTEDGMFTVDEDLLSDLIDEALEDMLGSAERYAHDLREAITTGDSDGLDLDELLDRVGEAAERGGNWLRLNARTIGTALAGKSSLEQARALGVTHSQWISRRDDRVRPTHVIADGQVRPIGDRFTVGAHELEYPGDPSGLPGTAGEVMGCRCGLIFADVDDAFFAALAEIGESAREGTDAPGVAALLSAALASTDYGPGSDIDDVPGIASQVLTPEPVVGWRVLDVVLDAVPGQTVVLPLGTTLGLAAPESLTPATLGVLVPARTLVGVAGGTLVLGESTTVQVLAAGAGGMQGQVLAP